MSEEVSEGASSSLLGPGSHWDENAFERLKTHRLTPSALHQDRIAKAAAAEAQGRHGLTAENASMGRSSTVRHEQ